MVCTLRYKYGLKTHLTKGILHPKYHITITRMGVVFNISNWAVDKMRGQRTKGTTNAKRKLPEKHNFLSRPSDPNGFK